MRFHWQAFGIPRGNYCLRAKYTRKCRVGKRGSVPSFVFVRRSSAKNTSISFTFSRLTLASICKASNLTKRIDAFMDP
jgi:hypothetical protein